MSQSSKLFRLLLRTPGSIAVRKQYALPTHRKLHHHRHAPIPISQTSIATSQKRWQSAGPAAEDWKMWDFEQVKGLANSKNSNIVLIDVREPHEYKDGHIPTSENMPITSSPDALFLSAQDFEERFGFPKPSADTEVVFYCKSGVRSKASATLARQAGFKNVGEYRGSWKDWSAKGGTAT